MNKQVQQFQFHPVVIEETRTLTPSLKVAECFGKRHDNVMRDIKNLEVPDEFSLLNFEERDHVDLRGKKQKMYMMTKDGFMILVMGYTGPKAMQFKIAFIEAFNMMEWKLSQPARERETKLLAYYEREAVRRERKDNKVSDAEILRMVELKNQRFTNPEISQQLQRSKTTVAEHLRIARQAGLIDLAPGQTWLLPEVH